MKEEVFYPLKRKIIIAKTIFPVLIVGGVCNFFLLYKPSAFWMGYSILMLLGGIFSFFVILKSFFSKKSGLYLSSSLLTIKSITFTLDISWKEIKSFYSLNHGKSVFIAIDLVDNEKGLQAKIFYSRRTVKKMLITVNWYDVSEKELMTELNDRLEKYRS
jgi:hypothetical protein